MVYKSRASLKHKKVGFRKRRGYSKKSKRWNVNASASAFGYSGSLRLGSRSLKSAVKQVVRGMDPNLHITVSHTGQTMTHATLGTMCPLSWIQLSRKIAETVGGLPPIGDGYRTTERIHPISMRYKGYLNVTDRTKDSNITFLFIRAGPEMQYSQQLPSYMPTVNGVGTITGFDFGAGIGSTQLFRGNTIPTLQDGIIETRNVTLIKKLVIDSRGMDSSATSGRALHFDFYVKFDKDFIYKQGSQYGDKGNYYLVAFAEVYGGTVGTTSVATIVGNVDLIYKDLE